MAVARFPEAIEPAQALAALLDHHILPLGERVLEARAIKDGPVSY